MYDWKNYCIVYFCVHKWVKSIVFAVSKKICNESCLPILRIFRFCCRITSELEEFFTRLQRKLLPVAPSWIKECRWLFVFLFVFFIKEIGFSLFNLRCKCLHYTFIWIKLSAINIVAYLFLSHREKLIWHSKASPKNDFWLANIQGQQHIENIKSTFRHYWHDFKDFFTLCQKKRFVSHLSLLIAHCGVARYIDE